MPKKHFTLRNTDDGNGSKCPGVYAPKRPRLMSVLENVAKFHQEPDRFVFADSTESMVTDESEVSSSPDNSESVPLDTEMLSSTADSESDCEAYYDASYGDDDNEESRLEEDPRISPELRPRASMSVSHKELLSPNIRMGIELLDICNRARVSLKVFDEIGQCFKRNSKHGVDPEKIPSRDHLYKIFRKNFKVAPPEMVPVPSAPNIFFPKFPFLDQLINNFSMDLFRDPCMSNIKGSMYVEYLCEPR